MTLAGVHVRTIGAGFIEGSLTAIDATMDLIAVSADRFPQRQVIMFDVTSGNLVRWFEVEGVVGEAVGEESDLHVSFGLRFTPDGNHILVTELYYNQLLMFTMIGAFVRCVLQSCSTDDVGFASNGDILMPDRSRNRVCVFSPDGVVFLRNFGCRGTGDGQFKVPAGLAMCDDQLYVLDCRTNRVQVFK